MSVNTSSMRKERAASEWMHLCTLNRSSWFKLYNALWTSPRPQFSDDLESFLADQNFDIFLALTLEISLTLP